MLLNALQQNFVINFDPCFFYPEVSDTWMPVLDRMWVPYANLEDFINSQISSINFPGVSTNPPTQNIRLYPNVKRPGFQMDQLITKQLTLSIKTTESYISYFIMRDQFRRFLALGKYVKSLFMNPLNISLINDGGYEIVSYVFKNLTPISISDLQLSYAATLGNFNTFTMTFAFNYYDVYVVNGDGKRELIASDYDPQLDSVQEVLDSDNEKYRQKAHLAISTKNQERRAEDAINNVGNNNMSNSRKMRSLAEGKGNSLLNTTLIR